jgi:hypothetical protein
MVVVTGKLKVHLMESSMPDLRYKEHPRIFVKMAGSPVLGTEFQIRIPASDVLIQGIYLMTSSQMID